MPTLKKRKVALPMMTRVGKVEPKSLNEEERTVEIIFTKGSRVKRSNFWDGTFYEELGLGKKEVRMKRLQSGRAPFLDSHGYGEKKGVRSTLGVIDSAELIPDKEGRAVVRFSRRSDADEIFQDVRDGILGNVSVGYHIHRFEKVAEIDKIPVFRATDWEPAEVSLVPVGADPDSKVRSEQKEARTFDCEIVEEVNEENKEQEINENKRLEGEQTMPTLDEKKKQEEEENKKMREEAAAEARKAEKARAQEIRSIVEKTKLDPKLAETYIEQDKSVEDVRSLVIEEIAKRDEKPENQTPASNEARVGKDIARDSRVKGMANALLHRFRPEDKEEDDKGKIIVLRGYELEDCGRAYRYMTLLDMARECLRANGVDVSSHPGHRLADLALSSRGLHSTSDFPEILANVVNKTLRNGYLAAPITWKPFTSEVFVPDFKEISRTNLGDAPDLEKLEEGSKVKRGTISEAAEKYYVEEYAKILGITRKIIINDDLNFVAKLPERMGRRARDLESDLVWQIIKDNAALADTYALFSSQHGNLSTTPAAPSENGLTEARTAIRRQTGLDGAEISLTPRWTFVPPAHETAMEKLLTGITPNQSSQVNPFGPGGRTRLLMDVEPRLETGTNGSLTAWYVMCQKDQVDMVELARLTGTNGPQTMTKEGFDVHGVEIKIMHDVGAKAIDFRGLFKNAGA
jgi:hypothetical protein